MKKAKKATKKKVSAKKAAKVAVKVPVESGIEAAPTERVQIYGDWQNPMWKKGLLPNGDGCKVFVPKRFSNRLKNKVVECERVDENGETYYKYIP
jgi:hypothetical protein